MLSELISKVNTSLETYGLDFDFAEVEAVQRNGLLTCRFLQRGFLPYKDCLILGEFYYPAKGDKGVIIFVGKQKYPCFYAFGSGNAPSVSGEYNIEIVAQVGDIVAPYTSITEKAKDSILLRKVLWDDQITIEEILRLYDEIGKGLNIDPNLLIAQTKQESGFNPKAVSSAGAQGWSQFMPATARDVGLIDSFNVAQSIVAQGKYMGQLLVISKGNVLDALGRYNGGANWRNKTESQNYVRVVKSIWMSYK